MPRFSINQPKSALSLVKEFLRYPKYECGPRTPKILALRNIPDLNAGSISRILMDPTIHTANGYITGMKDRRTGQNYAVGAHTIIDLSTTAIWCSHNPNARQHFIFPTQLQVVNYLAHHNVHMQDDPARQIDDMDIDGYLIGRYLQPWLDWDEMSYDVVVDGKPVRFCIKEIVNVREEIDNTALIPYHSYQNMFCM